MSKSDPHRPSLLRRKGCWLTLAAGIPLLIGLAWLVESWAGRRQLEKTKARLAAEGFETDPARLLPPRPPDAENFCATPFMLAIGSGTASGPEIEAIRRIGRWHTAIIEAGAPFRVPENTTPTDWGKVRDAVAAWDVTTSGLVTGSSDPVTELVTVIDRDAGPVLAELAGALGRPQAVLVPEAREGFQTGRGYFSSCPWFSQVGAIGTVCYFRGQTDLAIGNSLRAVESCRILLRLYEGGYKHGTMLGAAGGNSARVFAIRCIWAAAESKKLDAGGWRVLNEALHRLRPLDMLPTVLGVELAYCRQACDGLRASPAELAPLSGSGVRVRDRAAMFVNQVATQCIPRGWFDFNESWAIESVIELRRRVDDTRVPDRFDAVKRQWRGNAPPRFPYHGVCVRRFLGFANHGVRTLATDHAICRLAEAACALEAHHAEHHSYPPTLGALVPQYLAAVPLDLDGKPIRYALEPRNGRYKLWSVGLNGTDEGGAEISETPRRRPWPWRERVGDWLWQYP